MSEERALLLTDLVDSTQQAASIGDEAAAELSAAHDRVARDLLRQYKGREIDKTDGMLVLFEQADAAAAYAIAYHAALAALPTPLKARVGLHVGPVILRANSDEDIAHGAKPLEVEGIAKPIAARIMSLALGGQTLLSREARDALGETKVRIQAHGFWRIKGIAEPVQVFELGDECAPFTPPPDSDKVYRVVRHDDLWLPLRQVRHNLPAERDAFVGRDAALVELARRFDNGAHLVSLLGIGGTGKTRLALRFARTWLGEHPGGVWFCDLSPARDVNGVLHAVAKGLDVPLGTDDPVVQLGHAIAGRRRCLVILDNFEQVARHADATLGQWLNRAVEARFLVTTREVLGLPGEEVLALEPLGQSDAVALFVRRAASARRDFDADPEEQSAIARLVRLLDRLPLAIELAAARVRILPPSALLSRMGQRFKLMAALGGRQDRQSTLRATFDWSWDLLSDAEKAALAQLSVFEGGFTLDSCESVLDLSACGDAPWVVDVVQSLTDKSLVRAQGDGRFDLLTSVQDYAAEQLQLDGQFPGSGANAQTNAERAHCTYFASLDAETATAHGCVETDNLVAACRRALRMRDTSLCVAALENAWSALDLHGPFRIGFELAEATLSLLTATPELARAHVVAMRASRACGLRAQEEQHAEEALSAARLAQDRAAESQAQAVMAALLADAGRADEARAAAVQAVQAADDSGDPALRCGALNTLGSFLMDHGALDAARSQYEQALHIARGAGLAHWEGGILGNLANLDIDMGRSDDARAKLGAAIDAARRTGDLKFAGNNLCNLGWLEHLAGRTEAARAHFDSALSIAREIGHRQLECIVLCNLGVLHDDQNKADDALAHLEQAIAIARELQDHRSEGQFLGYLGLALAHASKFADARSSTDLGEALLLELADPFSLALMLCARAEVEQLAQCPDAARRYLNRAEQLAQGLAPGASSELGLALAKARSVCNDTTATVSGTAF